MSLFTEPIVNLPDFMNTPRIYTAIAEWAACMVYILLLKKKITGKKLVLASAGGLLVFSVYQHIAGKLHILLWIPSMLGVIALMFFFIHGLCKEKKMDSAFFCVRAFVLAEFTASLHWQLYIWWTQISNLHTLQLSLFSMPVIYGIVFVLCYFLEKSQIPENESLNVNQKELFGAALIAIGAFGISNISFIALNTPFSADSNTILYVRTLVDFGGLVMLFAQQDKREELRMRGENQAMNIILQHQYDQYRLSIDNIELLRREFHDLKHYMIAIRSEQDPEKKERYLLEMEEAIAVQEALSNTGNSVLDVILTTKSTYCLQNNINFTCMADGKLISFLHVKDICSIFGNALDNAIECVSQFSDPEKRLITLSMYQQNRLLMIQCENYTETSYSLGKNQLPPTTKKDQLSHGYGLKSIRHAVEKYNGSMTIHARDNWFTLQILIPLAANTDKS